MTQLAAMAIAAVVIAAEPTEVAVDLSGEIAGKKALERAAAAIAERITGSLVLRTER